MGKEGRQAVRCSDFAFARFRFLRRVLLVHGHWYYWRISSLVQYFFYKNVAFNTPVVFFAIFSAYSTEVIPFDVLKIVFDSNSEWFHPARLRVDPFHHVQHHVHIAAHYNLWRLGAKFYRSSAAQTPSPVPHVGRKCKHELDSVLQVEHSRLSHVCCLVPFLRHYSLGISYRFMACNCHLLWYPSALLLPTGCVLRWQTAGFVDHGHDHL